MKPKKQRQSKLNSQDTSWGGVASWYDEYLQNEDTYQAKIIWPNLARIIDDTQGVMKFAPKSTVSTLCDIACGQGQFAHTYAQKGYQVTGADVSKELIEFAKKTEQKPGQKSEPKYRPIFHVAPSHNIPSITSQSQDIVTCVLALQNIKLLDETIQEVARILKTGGRFIFVLNHPSFRIPQFSDWYFDTKTQVQSRIVSKYMQESTLRIDMNPGERLDHKKIFTVSFHRPLQTFIKLLAKHGFLVRRLEEWGSHKRTTEGPRRDAENLARKEIPMFMCIEAIKGV